MSLALIPNNSWKIVEEITDGESVFYLKQRHRIFRCFWAHPWENMISGQYAKNSTYNFSWIYMLYIFNKNKRTGKISGFCQ